MEVLRNGDKISIVPHISGGLATPEQLRLIAGLAERYGAQLKITGNGIRLAGLSREDGGKAAAELNLAVGTHQAKSVRAVSICAGRELCRRALQDSSALGLQLDEAFFGLDMPGNVSISISGCPNCCSGGYVKDIGIFGTAKGFSLLVGGRGGRKARAGRIVASAIPFAGIRAAVEQILRYYQQHGKAKEHLGDTLDRIGWEELIAIIGAGMSKCNSIYAKEEVR